MFRVYANIDMHLPLAEIAAAARRAEAIGFDCVSIPDVCHDGLVAAAIAIGATERIQVANSALVCFPRSPMTTAVAVWDLQAYSSGRYRLGLGPLVAPNIIQKYSTPWYPPAPRMREYVRSMQAIFRCWQYGEKLDFRGKYYQFTRQQVFTAPPPIAHPDIPLHLAAIGPHMTALAGELADGISTHPTNTSPRYIREVMLANIERGARLTGRSRSDIEIIVNPMVATGTSDEAVQHQRARHRATLAILFSTPNYWPSLDLFGWNGLGERLRQMVREGRWSETASLFSDEMADIFVPAARYDELADILREQYGGLADAIGMGLPSDSADDGALARVVERLHGA